MRIAGELGSAGLPAAAGAKTIGKDKATFTMIDNKGAIALAKTET
jgi:oxidoreductase